VIALWSALTALLLLVLIVGSVLVGALLDHGRRLDRLEARPTAPAPRIRPRSPSP
jgi:hypothetical protein